MGNNKKYYWGICFTCFIVGLVLLFVGAFSNDYKCTIRRGNEGILVFKAGAWKNANCEKQINSKCYSYSFYLPQNVSYCDCVRNEQTLQKISSCVLNNDPFAESYLVYILTECEFYQDRNSEKNQSIFKCDVEFTAETESYLPVAEKGHFWVIFAVLLICCYYMCISPFKLSGGNYMWVRVRRTWDGYVVA